MVEIPWRAVLSSNGLGRLLMDMGRVSRKIVHVGDADGGNKYCEGKGWRCDSIDGR